MSRTHRLFELMQTLRRHRQPVSGAALAREAGVSVRTLYRDIAALQALGAGNRGRAGAGLRAEARLPVAAADVFRRRNRGAGARRSMGGAAHGRGPVAGGAQRHGENRRRAAAGRAAKP